MNAPRITVRTLGRAGVLGALFCAAAAVSWAWIPPARPGVAFHKQSERFGDVVLTTQHGRPLRFYRDLVRDRTVIINLMYTSCTDFCPAATAELAQVNELLGERVGRDIAMVSLSIDPVTDTPAKLKAYWEAFGSKPGWLFLTGSPADIERLRRQLGGYDLDPTIDADPEQHAGIVTVGNDRTNRWAALPLWMDRRQLAATILRVAGSG